MDEWEGHEVRISQHAGIDLWPAALLAWAPSITASRMEGWKEFSGTY